jgi:phosphohistidine phosphatase
VDLYLVRHAIAADRDAAAWPDDSLRPLTEAGAARFRLAARGLSSMAPSVERVLSSPYPRAWQTAEILHEEAHWPTPQPCPELEATRSPSDVVGVLQEAASSSVALVGHEPLLSSVASLLLTGNADMLLLELKKGGAALLELPQRPTAGNAVLRWSLSPRVLRMLARQRG